MATGRRQWFKLATVALSAAWLGLSAIPAPALAADKITVFAAASMKNALDNLDAAFTKETGKQVTVSYAASGPLAKQLENGAPADVFISADKNWMDYVAEKKLIKDDSRIDLLGNKLVLVAAKDKAKPVEIKQGTDLAGLLGDGRLAIGQPESVPAGKYGKAALEKLGIWSSVEKKVAGAESVRAALALVSRGEAPYGIVYQTDVSADPGVAVVGTFPEDSHPPIVYPIAITATSTNPDTQAYVDYLKSAKAVPFFEHEGFTVLKR
ncbi:molybdate ABC transporter substrate-binding protein [Agrobacterium rhizogenes]|uniref:molybdate ABC transporter substrate-binding protein n=1 Tax=Rhizobium rhizogenes TaxID=359 RepID=UPI001572DE47|nr:molybdate ABC transporter substrate-binding protein [Rhizobium rhizogenes]NTG47626.1 molybdate ABC transporter substrate-binding protein [Rhizobium rhizogenes]